MILAIYKERTGTFHQKAERLQQRLGWLSFIRLLVFVAAVIFIYQSAQGGGRWVIASAILLFLFFLILVRLNGALQRKKQYFTALAHFNEKEIQFLQTHVSPYNTGNAFAETHHPYSFDLDLFAEGGLYAHLNRCSTPFGKQALSRDLLNPDTAALLPRQDAVKELAEKIDFRHTLYAYGRVHHSKKKEEERLMQWIDADDASIHRFLYYLLTLFPLATIGSIVYYLATGDETGYSIFSKLFVVNLIIAVLFSKKITAQLSVSTSVANTLQNYSNQLKLIGQTTFQSSLLRKYQQDLHGSAYKIGQLASLFNYLETVINLLVSLLLNGLFLFHVHILYRLQKWKKQHAHEAKHWLQQIGNIESLSSLGNLAYNNPHFCMPQLSTEPTFEAKGMGHVLVPTGKRVCNNVSFQHQKFVVLTGSNMSGKSTFLRTLGTNLVLAKAGSVVCAEGCTFYPFQIFVSMRITDSLQDSESLFYAELKRLQSIIKSLQNKQHHFVILDEILRGTNSNDKRNGTIGLIRKLAKFDTFGMIATHDLIVAELIKEYPNYIANKAFESAIVNDTLQFDYKLKDGVCNTLSASYLMRKMEII